MSGFPFSSIVIVSVVNERIWYRLAFQDSNFEYESVVGRLAAVRASGGRSIDPLTRSETACGANALIMIIFVHALRVG